MGTSPKGTLMTIYVLDTETTGVTNHPTHGHPQIIELALIPLEKELTSLKKKVVEAKDINSFLELVEELACSGEATRFKPSMQIHRKAVEVHGIKMLDLLKEPKSETLKLPEVEYMLGHNIQYDYRCLGKPEGIKLICTLSLARKMDKKFGIGFKNHKQDDLLLHFYGETIRSLVTGHHAALYDCVKCLLLLVKLLEYVPNIKTYEELYEFQQLLKAKK